MSIKLMTWAWETSFPQTEKMVLLCLCDFANDHGACWPAVATIARKCSVTDRTVQRAIKRLLDWGVLTVDPSRGKANEYHINPRHSVTPDTVSPPTMTTKPPTQCHPTPDTVSPKPSKNHQEPSESGEQEFTVDHVFDFWNEKAPAWGKALIRERSPERRKLVQARSAQHGLDGWREVFGNFDKSEFLQNAKGIQFDWVIQKKNFTKIHEGNYNG